MTKDEKKLNTKFIIIAIICICIFSIGIVTKAMQNDTFYTIKLGEIVLENGIDMQEHFAWHEGLPYTYPHWLYDVFMYLIYAISGFNGIYISTIIFTAILGITIYLTNTKLTKNSVIPFFTTIAVLLIGRGYLAARAQLLTFILFVLEIYYIERFLETKKKRFIIGLLIIPTLIANIHAAVFPFYFILYLPYIAEYVIAFFNKNNKKETYKIIVEENLNVKYLILIMVIAMFTGFLTPIGDTPYTYLYNTMRGETTKEIYEHLPIVLYEAKCVLIYIIIANCLITFTKIKVKLSDLFLICGLILLTLMSNRQQSMLFFIGIFVINKIVCNLFTEDESKYLLKLVTSNIFIIILCAIFVTFTAILWAKTIKIDMISEDMYPVKAAKYIKNNLNVNDIKLYNEYNFGSYLLFEDIPVFIDSRADVYDSAFNKLENDIFMDYIGISEEAKNYEYKFEKYGITHLLIYRNLIMDKILKLDENYNQIYGDSNFVIYERLSNKTK